LIWQASLLSLIRDLGQRLFKERLKDPLSLALLQLQTRYAATRSRSAASSDGASGRWRVTVLTNQVVLVHAH
jgi:hypothetical protein